MTLTAKGIGERVRKARNERRLGLRGVAKAIGVSPTTLSRLELGKNVHLAVALSALNFLNEPDNDPPEDVVKSMARVHWEFQKPEYEPEFGQLNSASQKISVAKMRAALKAKP